MKTLLAVTFGALVMAGTSLFAADHKVDIKGMVFDPANLTVEVGDSVTFTNQDSIPHTGTATDKSFDTGILTQGQSSTVEITKEGVTDFFCAVHPSMKGEVTATAAAEPEEEEESDGY